MEKGAREFLFNIMLGSMNFPGNKGSSSINSIIPVFQSSSIPEIDCHHYQCNSSSLLGNFRMTSFIMKPATSSFYLWLLFGTKPEKRVSAYIRHLRNSVTNAREKERFRAAKKSFAVEAPKGQVRMI